MRFDIFYSKWYNNREYEQQHSIMFRNDNVQKKKIQRGVEEHVSVIYLHLLHQYWGCVQKREQPSFFAFLFWHWRSLSRRSHGKAHTNRWEWFEGDYLMGSSIWTPILITFIFFNYFYSELLFSYFLFLCLFPLETNLESGIDLFWVDKKEHFFLERWAFKRKRR